MRHVLWAVSAWAAAGGLGAAVALQAEGHESPRLVEDSCKPEGRRETAEELLTPWDSMFSRRVEEAFADITGPAMLTVGDGHYNAMFFNFIAHLNQTAWDSKVNFTVVTVALDELGFRACQALQKHLPTSTLTTDEEIREVVPEDVPWFTRMRQKFSGFHETHKTSSTGIARRTVGLTLRCVSLWGWLPSTLLQHSEKAGVRGTGTCSYNMIIWTKPHILKAAMKTSQHGVLMIDTDVVVKKDIIAESLRRLGQKKDASLVTGIENHAENRINTGTVFLKPGPLATSFLYAWIELNSDYLNDDHGDQAALQKVLDHNTFLAPYAVTYGDAVGECSRPGTVATHYNCWVNKLAPMKNQGDWDSTAQRTREQLGLLAREASVPDSPRLRRRVEAMEVGGDWLVRG